MKQLPITPELSALIKKAVGQDVDTADLAVFETIALNTKPLPGKRGTIFENAVVQPITLKEMVDHVNGGQHLPLIADHELFGAPKGRFFHAGLDYSDGLELRALFYLDPTEDKLIAKINAGSLDEVSVAFLASHFNCSECGWDYFNAGASWENIEKRICANGHKIGENGVHGEMQGLNQFIELSVVARGAAKNPKIVGRSEAKLAPTGLQVLAASGFQVDELVVQASLGSKEELNMDITALTAQLTTLSTEKGTLTANLSAAEQARDAAQAQVTALTAEKTSLTEQVATLTAEKTALEARPEAEVGTERDEAVTFLQEQVNHLLVASGKPKLEGDALPGKVADLKAKISELTGNLTSILPVGGRSNNGDDKTEAKLSFDPVAAYGLRK